MERIRKPLALSLSLLLLAEWMLPATLTALTGGPAQPEFSSFTAVSTKDMVDPFTGDLTYNIPLMDVDGYPVNLAYRSGASMDEEASWVGLGWNLNMGVMNRSMRGFPDDFNGESVVKESNIKENKTWGVKAAFGFEIFGLKKGSKKKANGQGIGSLDFNLGIFKNSYTGLGFEFGASLGISAAAKGGLKGGLGLGLGYNSHEGLSPSINASLSAQKKKADQAGDEYAYSAGASVSTAYNSRSGLKALAVGVNAGRSSVQKNKTGEEQQIKLNSLNGDATIPTGSQSYTPQVQLPMESISGTMRVTVGGEVKGTNMHGSVEGYFSKQRLAHSSQSNPAYGYFYAQNADADNALLDFNREKDGVFTEKTPNLPVSNFTYDIFSASGHGVSGMFRPFRGDVGVLSDPLQKSGGTGNAGGVEVGLGDIWHVGVNFSLNFASSRSTRWTSGNSASSFYRFLDRSAVTNPAYRPLHEIFYFKEAGEKTIGDGGFDAGVGGVSAVRLRLAAQNATAVLEDDNGQAVSSPRNARSQREKRQQVMTALTASEAATAGLLYRIDEYADGDFDISSGRYNVRTMIPRVNANAKAHHLSELSVVKPDGSRYVYGIPAYNIEQKDVTFAVAGNTGNCSTGLVSYGSGDNSTGNTKGTDNYFNRTTIPAYAHSYLLTAVLSSDYADRTGNGVSDDDGGTAVKFNYTRRHDDFRWRVPFDLNTASFNEGMKSNPNDDKGAYIYGRKEIWYVHSIETKSHVAEFHLSPRHDGFGVTGENGGIDQSKPLYRLDSIRLFSKEDRIANGANAEPIKSVHFRYDYSLCPGIPNTNVPGSGKLTLKRVYFTYGKLPKGAVNAYGFTYSSVNPSYNVKGYDRWGNYKPNAVQTDCNDIANPNKQAANPDDPYVEQNKASADQMASAWQLTGITLPSKGTISITYESDDYAHVQQQRAMRMVRVRGVSSAPTPNTLSTNLFVENSGMFSGYSENDWLCFDLPPEITSRQGLKERMLPDGSEPLHFRFLMDVTGKGDYEYVMGYAAIKDYDVTTGPNGPNTRGWIQLKPTTLSDKSSSDAAHPISKAAWQMARLEMGSKIFPGSDPQGEGESAIKGLLGFVTDVQIMISGYNRTLRGRGFGQKFVENKSMIRLVEPSRRRLGGGVRVRRIESSDQWTSMAGGSATSASYGQEFTYTMSGKESNDETSSGVAAYEPMVGGNENPFHQPVTFINKHFMAPDDQLYLEKPFGEAHLPDPSVGYRRVTIRDIYDHNKHTSTGKVVHEFYTALDFPARATQTDVAIDRVKPKFLDKLFKARSLDLLAASQGYAIDKNDMHGKPQAQWTYAEGGTTPISGIKYFYRVEPGDPTRLRNEVTVIDSAGNRSQKIVGRDIDMTIDMRETLGQTKTTDITTNVDGFSLPPLPAIPFVPTIWGKTTKEKTRFRSAVVTKAIYRYGILDSVVAYEDGARVSTANIAYDAETGEVVLTRTANTFRDPVYNFTYPAHWAYDGMGPAYRNIGMRLGNVSVDATGKLTLAATVDAGAFLVRGDEVLLTGSSSMVAWVIGTAANKAMLVDRAGVRVPAGSYDLLVIRSGRRNQQSQPIGTVSSLADPLASGKIAGFTKVLNAETIEYSDIWGTACGVGKTEVPGGVRCDTLTPAVQQLGPLLFDIASQGKLTTSFQFSPTIPSYQSNLANLSPPHYWVPNSPVSATPTTTFSWYISGTGPNGGVRCPLKLVSPTPVVWSSIVGFIQLVPDPAIGAGNGNHSFLIDAVFANGSRITMNGTIECLEVLNCRDVGGGLVDCGVRPGALVNPFVWGLWGNWKRSRSLAYLVDRNPTSPSASPATRYDGQYASFSPYWAPPVPAYKFWQPSPANWTWTAQVTRIAPDGFELENQDALGRYSGALYGYLNTLPTAVASNARYRWIASDGFEDYDTWGLARRCKIPRHWDFSAALTNATLDGDVSHTGMYSLRLPAGNSAGVTRSIDVDCRPSGYLTGIETHAIKGPAVKPDLSLGGTGSSGKTTVGTSKSLPTSGSSTATHAQLPLVGPIPLAEYKLQLCDCNGLFSPEAGHTYVFSGWVREELTPPLFNTGAASVTIDITGSTPNSVTLSPSGLIVEGWRRVEGTFTIPAAATGITVTLRNGSGAPGPAWFDDLRIHPYQSTMKAYVYDPVSLRLMAILDERNYASLYEYNYEGQLTRLKKETERGIVTVQESRSDLRKN